MSAPGRIEQCVFLRVNRILIKTGHCTCPVTIIIELGNNQTSVHKTAKRLICIGWVRRELSRAGRLTGKSY
jgi:hypothetical protein